MSSENWRDIIKEAARRVELDPEAVLTEIGRQIRIVNDVAETELITFCSNREINSVNGTFDVVQIFALLLSEKPLLELKVAVETGHTGKFLRGAITSVDQVKILPVQIAIELKKLMEDGSSNVENDTVE